MVLEICGPSGVGERSSNHTGQAETRYITHPDSSRTTSHRGYAHTTHSSSRFVTITYTHKNFFFSGYTLRIYCSVLICSLPSRTATTKSVKIQLRVCFFFCLLAVPGLGCSTQHVGFLVPLVGIKTMSLHYKVNS